MWLILSAMATEPATCPPAEALLPTERWLRAVSLDLRGRIPDPQDYQRIVAADALPTDLVDEWLASEDFVKRAVRHHRSLLWPGFEDLRFVNNRWRVNVSGGIWRSSARDLTYRGEARLDCGTQPAQFGSDGELIIPANRQEGWVRVHPYWEADPTVTIKVCALDARDAVASDNGIACNEVGAATEPACGCGPELIYCQSPQVDLAMRSSLERSSDARVADVIRSDRPYTDLLTADTAYLDGPLVHFYKHQAGVPASVRVDLPPLDADSLPALPYHHEEHVAVATHSGHSGVLTDPSFLIRFMSNRSRVNQFYSSFLCQPFTAPAGGITGLDAQNPTLDLTVRDGCRYCHALMEPETAYWGRWTEGGAGWLDPALYPSHDPACAQCSQTSAPCDQACALYYTVNPISDELDPFVGSLRALQFLPAAEHARVEQGPAALVEANIANGKLQSCVTEKAATWLLGRELHADDQPATSAWTASLVGQGWSYRALVKSIVLSESYRRAQ